MYLFSGKFWDDFVNDPRIALDSLKAERSRIWHPIVKACVFWRIVFSEYRLDHGLTRASALAFGLLLTLIPLVVTIAFMLASLMEVRAHQVEQFFSLLLPFAPQTVLDYLATFFANAQRLRGWGIAILFVVSVGLFGAVEESLNTIWKLTRTRSFFIRVRAFTMGMIYAPLLFFLSFEFRRSPWFDVVSRHFFPLDLLPFLLMVLAFTSLIWFVPQTKVRFGSAFLGGLTAGLLFELERRGFNMFVHLSIQTQTIYGAFSILPLFLLSLYVVSVFILFGAVVAYVHQNFRALLRAIKRWDRRASDYKVYISFRMFTDAVAAFAKAGTPPTAADFIAKYELTEQQAAGMLNWLVHANFLHCTSEAGGYVPARDFSGVPVMEVLDVIVAQDLRVSPVPEDYTREFVASLLNNSRSSSRAPAEQITFADMIANLNKGKLRVSNAATPA